jgi:phage portal protein BeeE
MSFFSELFRRKLNSPPDVVTRNDGSYQAYVDQYVMFQQSMYGPGQMYSTSIPGEKAEPVASTYLGYANGIYKTNSPVFSVSMARARLFSEMRFAFRTRGSSGGGNDLDLTDPALDLLARPGGPKSAETTQSMLTRMEQDVTTAGTAFLALAEDGERILRRRPDWMEFILTAPVDEAVEADIAGYRYTVGGPRGGGQVKYYLPGECIHWAPIPDPEAAFRGMSWLTPVIEEFQADKMATTHKRKFFENAATPNMIMVAPPTLTPAQFKDFVRISNETSAGLENAYKTLHVGGGMDPRVIGTNFQQLEFRATQGAGETRIASAGGVPPIIVGMSEGLSSATYSNYGQARRAFADTWGSNQWRSACAAVSPLVRVSDGKELWYDTRDIPFLREDVKDLATVQSQQAATINALLASGWTSDSAVQAVLAEDFGVLKHSGLMSVQLQAPVKDDGGVDSEEEVQLTSAQAATLNGLMAAGAWEPDSVKAAVMSNDLNKLVLMEPEEPDPAVDELPVDAEQDALDAEELPG